LLLAAGTHDDSVPDKLYSNTRELAALMRNATGTTLWLENTGHSIHAERPDFFAQRIIDFLQFPDRRRYIPTEPIMDLPDEYRRGYPPPLYHLPPLEPIPWDDDDES